ncbi:hypothetical protein Tco_1184488 [Tanacetum coccineum]
MERAATTASSLEVEYDSSNINRTQSMATLNESFPQGTDSGSGPKCQDTILEEGVQKLKLVKTGVSKLMLLSLNLILPILVYAARHSLTVVRHKLMLPGITYYCWHLEGGVKFLMYLRFVQVFLDKQVEGMTKHKEVYVTPSHTKKVFANMKRPGKGFSGRIPPLFQIMMVQAPEDMGEDSAAPSDSYSTPIISQPSSSKHQKKKSRRK